MKRILVVFGGRSVEHDVSIITAINSIIKPLRLTKKYQVEPLYIAKDGRWYWDEALSNIETYSSGKIDSLIKKLKPVNLSFENGLVISNGKSFNSKKAQIDIVFPALHGTYGEDGDLMGLLEMAGVAYVGCGVAASAIAMDKVIAKQLAIANKIPTSNFLFYRSKDYKDNPVTVLNEINTHLNWPLFVKPTHLGSSIGISRVSSNDELGNAIELAFHYDDLVVVEEEVSNLIEVTLPIIGNETPEPAYLEEPTLQKADFFDFDAKYLRGGKKGSKNGQASSSYSEVPAQLPKKLYKAAEELGVNVYKTFGLSGIARVDMLIDSKLNKVYFNEINPLPGSLYSHNFQKFGLSNVELVEKLLFFAMEKFEQKNKLNSSFSTNYLKQF